MLKVYLYFGKSCMMFFSDVYLLSKLSQMFITVKYLLNE
jgi:hypothetical protein